MPSSLDTVCLHCDGIIMGALAAAVRPLASGVPRRAAPAPCDASECASGKKPQRVAHARDSSVCVAGVEELYVPSQKRKMTCNRNNVETAAAKQRRDVSSGAPTEAPGVRARCLARSPKESRAYIPAWGMQGRRTSHRQEGAVLDLQTAIGANVGWWRQCAFVTAQG
jgi:hypothetical protein